MRYLEQDLGHFCPLAKYLINLCTYFNETFRMLLMDAALHLIRVWTQPHPRWPPQPTHLIKHKNNHTLIDFTDTGLKISVVLAESHTQYIRNSKALRQDPVHSRAL